MNHMNKFGKIVSSDTAMDYMLMEKYINALLHRYKFLSSETIGKSYLGKDIEVLKIGEGAHEVAYIGAHHAMEWITSMLLMRFVEDFSERYDRNMKFYRYDPGYIFNSRTIYIIPMLNPDGVDLVINGVNKFNPVSERLIRINGGSEDFSRWQANARGVDLNHNYNAGWNKARELEIDAGIQGPGATRYGGDYPESEPEVQAATSFIRSRPDIRLLLALHTQGEVIYWRYGERQTPEAKSIGEMLARCTGYTLDEPEDIAAYAGCKDWFIEETGRPGYTLECGFGENPLPVSDFIPIYNKIAEALILGAIL